MPPVTRKPEDAPDAKGDPRHPDTVADSTPGTAAVPTDFPVDATDEDLNATYGFSTIDTSEVDHSKVEVPEPVKVDQPSGSAGAKIVEGATSHRNSTFAERAKERAKRSTTQVDRSSVTSK